MRVAILDGQVGTKWQSGRSLRDGCWQMTMGWVTREWWVLFGSTSDGIAWAGCWQDVVFQKQKTGWQGRRVCLIKT